MKISWRTELPMLLLIAAMGAVAAWTMTTLPEVVPVHWNARGQADGYGPRALGAWFTPALAGFFYLLPFALIPIAQDRAQALLMIRSGLLLFIPTMYAVIQLWMHGANFSMSRVTLPLIGALFAWLAFVVGRLPVAASGAAGARVGASAGAERQVLLIGAGLFFLAGLIGREWALFLALGGVVGGAITLVMIRRAI